MQFAPLDWFVLRTPRLPMTAWASLGEGLSAQETLNRNGDLSRAIVEDTSRIEAQLRRIFADPSIRKAIFFASAGLSEAVEQWLANGSRRRVDGLEAKLLQYLARMAQRPTPFGLFGGYSVGTVGGGCHLRIPAQEGCEMQSVPDFSVLVDMAEALRQHPEVQQRLRYWPNPTIYRAEDRLRYYEQHGAEGQRHYRLSAVDATEALLRVLDRARHGATRAELAGFLRILDPRVSEAEADEYLAALVQTGLLLDRLEPPLLSDAPVAAFQLQLDELDTEDARSAASGLRNLCRELDRLDQDPRTDARDYRNLADAFQIPASLPLRPAPFNALLRKPAEGLQLSGELVALIARGAELLRWADPPAPQQALEAFKKRFAERYEGREVALLEALDEELGIGYGPPNLPDEADSPWFSGLCFETSASAEAIWTRRDELLLQHLQRVWREGKSSLELTGEELAALNAGRPALNGSWLSVTATLVGRQGQAVSAENCRIWLHGIMPPSGMTLFTRFCAGDPVLSARVKSAAGEERHVAAIVAEIAHLPQPRAGNVLVRPGLCGHAIGFFGHAEGMAEIPLSDLRLQLVDGRLRLRSASLGREIIPRVTSAHYAPLVDLAAYRFLCALQYQEGLLPGCWDWGVLRHSAFLPRVETGPYILSPATWLISGEALSPLLAALARPADRRDEAIFRAAAGMRSHARLPRRVGLADGDMVLPVDLENCCCLNAMARHAKDAGHLRLIELLSAEPSPVTDTGAAAYAHEIVLPLRVATVPPESSPLPDVAEAAGHESPWRGLPRFFPPGSEWLSLKLYGSLRTLERVLTAILAPEISRWAGTKQLQNWFFIRYHDPRPHLRLRLQADPATVAGILLPTLNRSFRDMTETFGLTHFAYDTYEREVERYGGDRVFEAVEAYFSADSSWALAVIAGDADEGADFREMALLAGIHALLTAFDFSPAQRADMMKTAAGALSRDFGLAPPFDWSMGRQYRSLQPRIEALLRCGGPDGDGANLGNGALRHAFSEYRAATRRLGERLRNVETGRSRSLAAIATDLIHLSVNRIGRTRPRLLERVLMECLGRYYRGEAARHGTQ